MNNTTLKLLKDNADFLQKLYILVPQWFSEAEQGKLRCMSSDTSLMKCCESILLEKNIYKAKFYFGALFTASMTILASEDKPIIILNNICIGSGKDATILTEQDLKQLYWYWTPSNNMFWYLMAYYKHLMTSNK